MFGCDPGSEGSPGYSLYCPRCVPSGKKNPKCPKCEGTGKVTMTRCPNRCMTPSARQMFSAFGWYQQGQLPLSGGMLDQAHSYVKAMEILSVLDGMHQKIQMEKNQNG